MHHPQTPSGLVAPSGANQPCSAPIEIINLIIDQLAQDKEHDRQSWLALCRCLLVSRSFYLLTRKHIFSRLSLTFHPFHSSDLFFCKLHEILRGNPSLALDIRSLELHLNADSPFAKNSTALEAQYIGRTPYLSHPEFVGLLDLLAYRNNYAVSRSDSPPSLTRALENRERGMTSFTVKSLHVGLRFPQLSNELIVSLINIRCIPSLKRFRLEGVLSPPYALIVGNPCADKLRELVLKDIHFGTYRPIPTQARHFRVGNQQLYNRDGAFKPLASVPMLLDSAGKLVRPIRFPFADLEVLEVNGLRAFYDFLEAFKKMLAVQFGLKYPLRFSRVRVLRLEISVWEAPVPAGMIQSMFPSVDGLALHFGTDSTSQDAAPIRLPSLPQITNLRVSVFSYEYAGIKNPANQETSGALHCIAHVLETIEAPNELQLLDLEIEWLVSRKRFELDEATGVCEFIRALQESRIWDTLENGLDRKRYARLGKVQLGIVLQVGQSVGENGDGDNVAGDIVMKMPHSPEFDAGLGDSAISLGTLSARFKSWGIDLDARLCFKEG